jgi:ribosome-binding factor A
MTSPRLQRVADQVQRELATLIQKEVKDPRLGMVSVTGVEVSRDMAYADVYVTALIGQRDDLEQESMEKRAATVSVLNNAAGFLRSLLAKELSLRTTPKLRFHYDESISRGRYLSSLIDDAIDSDRR